MNWAPARLASVLRGSVLRGSVLRGSVLRGSVLRGSVLLGSVLSMGACASPPAPTTVVEKQREQDPEERTFVPLTADEKILADSLKGDVEYLSTTIGERNPGKPWQLSDAADYLASTLEAMELEVERSGYEAGETAAQNLSVTLPGGRRGDEILVVGAHYDSPPNQSGRNAGASGAAALLGLIRLMKGAPLERTLRFVFFAMGEPPHGDGEGRGARHVARALLEEAKKSGTNPITGTPEPRREVIGLLHIDRLGALGRGMEPGDDPIVVDVIRTPGAERLHAMLVEQLADDPVEIREEKYPTDGPDSDVRAFYESGIPVVAIRGPGGEESVFQPEALALVVMRLRRGIAQVVVENPTNDGMLTPLGQNLR